MEREQLYALITQQLIDDGYQKVADQLVASGVKVAGDHTPKQQLLRLFNRKLGEQIPSEDHRLLMQCGGGEERKELGLQDDYVTRFIAVCKDPVVCAGFSPAGDYAAIASEDCSVRVLEVDKMQTNIEVKGERPGEYDSTNPVYKIIYDHARPVQDIAFHPFRNFLITGASDCTIRLYDFTKSTAKRAFRVIRESFDVRSISIHPGGDFLLVGVDHPIIRLYDIASSDAFTASDPTKNHLGPIKQVRYSTDSKMFASASTDGSIKIWDAVNFSCVRTLDHAHNGEPISSVQFSRDGKHLLSGGLDKQARIWEISTGKEILTFGNEDKGKFSMSARYTFGEDQIIIADETSPNVFLYNAKTGELSSQLEGHSSHVRNISVSPVEHSFISCGDDSRARFWSI